MAEHLLGSRARPRGSSAESFAALERALAHAEAAGDQVMRRHIIGRIAAGSATAPPRPARRSTASSSFGRLTANDPMLDAGLRALLAAALAMAGRFDEAREHIVASDPLLDQAVETDFSLQSRWTVAEALEFAGDLAGAEQQLAGRVPQPARCERRGRRRERCGWPPSSRLLLCDQGRWDEAAAYLAYGEEVDGAEPVQGKIYSWYRFAARGRLAAQRGEFDEALELARQAVEVADRGAWLNLQSPRLAALAEVPGHRPDGRGRRRRRDGARPLRAERQRRRAARLRAQQSGQVGER